MRGTLVAPLPRLRLRHPQVLREAIEQVPDDATVEDVMERLYFLAKVAHGLDAAERGDVVPHDEIGREFLAGE